uniref:GNAT family N-acetyltransferase n=1 Tax=uncultured Allobacillus sp. TaxID=1638025 RepID=UPI002598418B|nr:N-acetyltransferase [uncultured Allobacillus sp.]
MNFIVRQEQVNDYKTTENVVKTAFESAEHSDKDEHNLVARIRKSDGFIPELSLVAVNKESDEILGHILLSEILIVSDDNEQVDSLALAPVSVLPDYQNKGIGKALIQIALEKSNELGFQSVIVMGYPEYYQRFGFRKSSLWQIKAPFEVPEDVFMAIELQKGSLDNVSGLVKYPSAFFG